MTETIHRECGTVVSFDSKLRSYGDPEHEDYGKDYYYAVCGYCDEDLFEFETEEETQ